MAKTPAALAQGHLKHSANKHTSKMHEHEQHALHSCKVKQQEDIYKTQFPSSFLTSAFIVAVCQFALEHVVTRRHSRIRFLSKKWWTRWWTEQSHLVLQ